MEKNIKVLEDSKLWDEFVDQSHNGTLAHKWEFLKIIEKLTNSELVTFGIFNHGASLVGVFPIFYKRRIGLKMAFSPPPGTGIPYLGIVLSAEHAELHQQGKEKHLALIAAEIQRELEEYSPDYTMFSLAPEFLDVRSFQWKKYIIVPRYTYTLDLSRPIEEIWGSLPSATKKEIEADEEMGLEVRPSQDMSGLLELQKERCSVQKSACKMKHMRLIQNLFDSYPENLKIYYLHNIRDDVVGAMLTREYKGKLSEWMDIGLGSIGIGDHANEFLRWNLIKNAKSEGYNKYELSGANDMNSRQLRTKFNPNLEMNYCLYKKTFLGRAAEWAYNKFGKNGMTNLEAL